MRIMVNAWLHDSGRLALGASPWPHRPGRITLAASPWPYCLAASRWLHLVANDCPNNWPCDIASLARPGTMCLHRQPKRRF